MVLNSAAGSHTRQVTQPSSQCRRTSRRMMPTGPSTGLKPGHPEPRSSPHRWPRLLFLQPRLNDGKPFYVVRAGRPGTPQVRPRQWRRPIAKMAILPDEGRRHAEWGRRDVINCPRCPPESCRIRKASCDHTRSRHQAALHPVGEGLARGSTAGQTVGGGLQRFVAKGFVAKGKLAGSTLWGAVPINRPCRVLCAFDLREPLNLPILAV